MSNIGLVKVFDYFNKISYVQDLNDNKFYFVDSDLNKALHDDIVKFNISSKNINPEDHLLNKLLTTVNYITISGYAEIVSIDKRNNSEIFGVIDFCAKTQYGTDDKGRHKILFRSLSKQYPDMLIITKQRYKKNKYAFGKFINYEKYPIYNLSNIVGEVNNYNDDISASLSQFNYKFEKFDKIETKKHDFEQLARLQNDRKNLTDINIFSIDGDSTTDIDDALHVSIVDKNNVEIGVHISDVSSIIKFNSDIEKKARHNFSSFYFPNKKTDMIPREYSDNLCSLKEDEYRFAISTIFTYNNITNTLENVKIQKSLIKNKKKLTYKEVDRFLLGKKSNIPDNIKNDIKLIKTVSELIDQNILNRTFKNNQFENSTQSELISRRLVEVFMIMTNSIMGYKLYKKFGNAILRVHNGFKEKSNFTISDSMPVDIRSKAEILNMKKGYYVYGDKIEEDNVMHFGIGLKYYTHFTSPIRRYVDLWNHYLINIILDQKKLYPEMAELQMLDYEINNKNNIYKLAYRDIEIIDIYHSLEHDQEESKELFGYIIGFLEPCTIVVYLEKLDKIVNIKLVNKKIEDILTVHMDKTNISVIKNANSDNLQFSIGQKIKVKISRNSSQIKFNRRLFFEIIEPQYSKWLLE